MNQTPYSIHTKSRPIRLAFLVDPERFRDDQFDAIVEYSVYHWGGRFNPIILTNGDVISDDWWLFLTGYDPDIIVSLISLSDDLIEQINSTVAPLEIEICKETDSNIKFRIPPMFMEGLRIYPTRENLRSLARALPVIEQANLVTFETKDANSATLRRFLLRNFGTFDDVLFTEALLKKVEDNHLKFQITDISSLKTAVIEICNQWRRVYPLQVSSTPRDYPWIWNPEREVFRDGFTVVVGDSWQDIVHFWNHPLTLDETKRTGTSEIWLPVELAKQPELMDVLPKWFNQLAGYLTQHNTPIHVVSHSLSENELQAIATNITQSTYDFQVIRSVCISVYGIAAVSNPSV